MLGMASCLCFHSLEKNVAKEKKPKTEPSDLERGRTQTKETVAGRLLEQGKRPGAGETE